MESREFNAIRVPFEKEGLPESINGTLKMRESLVFSWFAAWVGNSKEVLLKGLLRVRGALAGLSIRWGIPRN